MASLQNYNGRFCESEYEYAFITLLEKEGWQYLQGNKINRQTRSDVLYSDDLENFLSRANPDLLCLCQDRTHNFFAFLEFYDSVQR